jgi:hypothetical protein
VILKFDYKPTFLLSPDSIASLTLDLEFDFILFNVSEFTFIDYELYILGGLLANYLLEEDD